MRPTFYAAILSASLLAGVSPAQTASPTPAPSWIATSNGYTQMLLAAQLKHSPEGGSQQGLAQFDPLISDPTRADEIVARKDTQIVQAKIRAAQKTETNHDVLQDLAILDKAIDYQFRVEDYQLDHKVPFINASAAIYGGLKTLLDDQVPADRRPAAVIRLKKYVGDEPGFKSFAAQLEDRMKEQMAKPGVVYPSKGEMETELSRNKNYVDGIGMLFAKYKLTGWEPAYAKLKVQLADYDAWVTANVLPKARTDFRMPPAEYTLNLEGIGVDIPPAQLATMAHAAFTQIQGEMAPLAAQVAKAHGFPSTDYRDVIANLKKTQITGDAILPFYKARLKAIEDIIVAQQLISLPDRPAIIRLATAAETAQQPAPHMVAPPFLNNTGQKGEFVLPLNAPAAGAPSTKSTTTTPMMRSRGR